MILNLFKSKPRLKELIPQGFIDINSHVLPGVDDGAKNIQESIILISEMEKMGFNKVIGTPHTYSGIHNNTNKSIEKSYKNLIKINKGKIRLNYASEYMLDNSIIEKAQNKSLLCLKDNYLLVELSYIGTPFNLYEILFVIKTNGYIPIMAHPERYRYLFKNFNEYQKLKKIGCKFQLNLLSLTGYYGKDILKVSNYLLKNNLIDFVGSDIHNISHIKEFSNKIRINQINKIEEAINRNNLFF